MTLGAGALARPLHIADASSLHLGWVAMAAAPAAVLIASVGGTISRPRGIALLATYPVFVVAAVLA